MIQGLTGGLARAGSRLATGSELGLYLQRQVSSYNSNQTPDFGTLELDDRGELVIPILNEVEPQNAILPVRVGRRRWRTMGRVGIATGAVAGAAVMGLMQALPGERDAAQDAAIADAEIAIDARAPLFEHDNPWRRVPGLAVELQTYEVSRAEYMRYLESHPDMRRPWPDDRAGPMQPATHVTFEEAVEYCRSLGGRLPTRYEWEVAVGTFPDAAQLRDCLGANAGPMPVGHSGEVSASGFHELVSNVLEWATSEPGSGEHFRIGVECDTDLETKRQRIATRSWKTGTRVDDAAVLGIRCARSR
jgi:formylglycine-generating enzyme required for sulfatase activity